MEIKTTITEAKSWILGNKWFLIVLLAIILALTAAYYINSHSTQPEYASYFPAAAVSADISSGRIEEIYRDINRDRSQEEEVVASAKKKAVKAIADLDNDAVAAAWNARIGEYREQRKNKDSGTGNETN